VFSMRKEQRSAKRVPRKRQNHVIGTGGGHLPAREHGGGEI